MKPKTKKDTLKSLRKELSTALIKFDNYALNYVQHGSYRKQRVVLSMDAADAQGKLNGITVAELLAIVNMADQTKERIRAHCSKILR